MAAYLAMMITAAPSTITAAPSNQESNCVFYTETVQGEGGYSVCDDAQANFRSAFETWGLQKVGYPISQRYERDGFVTQAFQKAIMQWRADTQSVVLVNIFDDLHGSGFDDVLLQTRQTPKQFPAGWDGEGLTFEEVVQKRQALLDARPALHAAYFASSDPLTFFGLPTSEIQDMDNHYAIRLQRAVLQEWKEDVPWAQAGEVTIANGGDIAKELGDLPSAALQAEAHSHSNAGSPTHTHRDTLASDYLGSYNIEDTGFGTSVSVVVENQAKTRTIESNALPNHETGEFPNPGNPNTISAQNKSWTLTTEPTFVGSATPVRETGVAVNGIKFEPGTAERATCASGEVHRIEAIQDITDLGLDFNNAHVQPTGEYHYHGVSELLVDLYSSDQDLVHVAFAADGHLIYYSKSGAYQASYRLGEGAREGTNCTYTPGGPIGGETITFGSDKDGSLTSDWDYNASYGQLDECNGVTVDGQYIYLITNEYPYVPRCLMGEVSAQGPGGGPGEGPPGAGPGGRPDLAAAAETLGITEDELRDALGPPPPNLEAAAATLGITVEELEDALGVSSGGGPVGAPPRGGPPPPGSAPPSDGAPPPGGGLPPGGGAP